MVSLLTANFAYLGAVRVKPMLLFVRDLLVIVYAYVAHYPNELEIVAEHRI